MVHVSVSTVEQTQLVDITPQIEDKVRESGLEDGLCVVYVPHTTAGVTINENADPSVQTDILKELDKIVPLDDDYTHREGNSAAHIKASLMGSSVTVLVEDSKLVLGTWQGIYFCEFDGPRQRKIFIKFLRS